VKTEKTQDQTIRDLMREAFEATKAYAPWEIQRILDMSVPVVERIVEKAVEKAKVGERS